MSILCKALWTDITRLHLLNNAKKQPKFILKESPFDEIDDEEKEEKAAAKREVYVIIGLIFPGSEIYRERSYLIEMKLTRAFPIDPPEVRFLTPIYHPNIGKDGKFCEGLLDRCGGWICNTSLVKVVQNVVKYIDHPDIDSAVNGEVGREYMDNKSEFDRKAMEYVKKHGLPRDQT